MWSVWPGRRPYDRLQKRARQKLLSPLIWAMLLGHLASQSRASRQEAQQKSRRQMPTALNVDPCRSPSLSPASASVFGGSMPLAKPFQTPETTGAASGTRRPPQTSSYQATGAGRTPIKGNIPATERGLFTCLDSMTTNALPSRPHGASRCSALPEKP